MTMPNERTRSLRWGYEVLEEIRADDLVGTNDRTKAAELLCNYPTPAMLSEWIRSDVSFIPAKAALAIEETGELMRIIWRSPACSAALRRSLTFTLRHFPDRGSTRYWAVDRGNLSIREWLLPEDYFD
jgi:hypothetical protein